MFLTVWRKYGLPLRLDVLEDRGLLQRQPDIDRHADEQERDDERDPPAPLAEGVAAQVGPRADDHGQREDNPKRGRGLQPPGVIPTLLVGDVLGHVGDGTAVLPAEAKPLD